MQHVKRGWSSLLLVLALCMALAVSAFADDGDVVWLALSEDSGITTALIVTNTTVTDGVLSLTYNSDTLTYKDVEVSGDCVAMYSINDETEGVLRISWVAPGVYEADAEGTVLFRVRFIGIAGEGDLEPDGTFNDPDGKPVPLGETEPIAVDKSKLETVVEVAELLKCDTYTEESWAALEEALAAAKTVLADEDATQEEVDAAYADLLAAIAALEAAVNEPEVVDLSALVEAIIEASLLDGEAYTEESWSVLAAALEAAKAVLADTDVTQEEVDAATEALKTAIAGLVLADVTDPEDPATTEPTTEESTTADEPTSAEESTTAEEEATTDAEDSTAAEEETTAAAEETTAEAEETTAASADNSATNANNTGNVFRWTLFTVLFVVLVLTGAIAYRYRRERS